MVGRCPRCDSNIFCFTERVRDSTGSLEHPIRSVVVFLCDNVECDWEERQEMVRDDN